MLLLCKWEQLENALHSISIWGRAVSLLLMGNTDRAACECKRTSAWAIEDKCVDLCWRTPHCFCVTCVLCIEDALSYLWSSCELCELCELFSLASVLYQQLSLTLVTLFALPLKKRHLRLDRKWGKYISTKSSWPAGNWRWIFWGNYLRGGLGLMR